MQLILQMLELPKFMINMLLVVVLQKLKVYKSKSKNFFPSWNEIILLVLFTWFMFTIFCFYIHTCPYISLIFPLWILYRWKFQVPINWYFSFYGFLFFIFWIIFLLDCLCNALAYTNFISMFSNFELSTLP